MTAQPKLTPDDFQNTIDAFTGSISDIEDAVEVVQSAIRFGKGTAVVTLTLKELEKLNFQRLRVC